MAIQLFNTLTRKKEDFIPLEANKVKFYVCGPTVYNYIHIGNARSAVAFDTIRRYFEYRGYDVQYVSNFTDVDDKIIKVANTENVSAEAVAERYIQAFKEDTQKIFIKPANLHPRVMEHIPEIITFIERLIDKGYAYVSQGDVYFKTESFANYGHLSDQSLSDLLVGASERLDDLLTERKEAPLDFALWKQAKEGEVSWASPWGMGRPGWHIECSVMATQHLGHTIDIHGGGQDLAFPHHENEIAQSEACTGHTFANYWLHNGFVTVGKDDEKMSKSLGNFVLLRELLEEFDPLVVRYMLATTHYRRPLRYDQEVMIEAKTNVEKFEDILRRLNQWTPVAAELSDDLEWKQQLNEQEKRFVEAMDDDFNTSNGLTEIFALVKLANRYMENKATSGNILTLLQQQLRQQLSVFGLEFEIQAELLDSAIEALIEERRIARLNRDFARGDEIREQLKVQGILLDDTPQGTLWKRVTI